MHPLADIVGSGATVQIPTTKAASAIGIMVSGGGTVRIGDSTTTASLGWPVQAGGGLVLPYRGRTKTYAAGSVYVYVPVGATVSPAWFE